MNILVDVIGDSHAIVRNYGKRSHVLFMEFPPTVTLPFYLSTFYKTVLEYHTQDIDIDTVMIQEDSLI